MAEYTQQLQYKQGPGGSIEAVLTLRFPSGARRVFRERFTRDDGAQAAALLASEEGAPVVAGIIAGAGKKPDPARWWWENREAARFGAKPGDEVALHRWWKGLANASRATYRATFHEGPRSEGVKAVEVWWEALGKKRRNLAQNRHGESTGFVADVVSTVKSVDKAIDKSVLGKIAQVALPTFALGRWSIKNPSKAAAFIPGGSTAAEAIKTGVKYLPAAKKLAAGKVMQAASKALEAEGGELATGAAKQLGVASRLAVADAALNLGAGQAAKSFVRKAKGVLSGASLPTARAAYALARRTQENVGHMAEGRKPVVSPSGVMAAARAGKLQSNRPGKVTERELAAALAAGRVFFVRAA